MSTAEIRDYLIKQVTIQNNIVTYRALSRVFGIHVNKAKKELAHFLAHHDQPTSPHATYLVSAEFLPPSAMTTQSIDVAMEESVADNDGYSDVEGTYDAKETAILLVDESGLNDIKGRASRLISVHIYSLSPSPIREADHLCESALTIRDTDVKKGVEGTTFGRITGPHVQLKNGAGPIASTSKLNNKSKADAPASVAQQLNTASSSSILKQTTDDAKQKSTTAGDAKLSKPGDAKSKPTGKLDFSKAKTKEQKVQEKKEQEEKTKTDKAKSKPQGKPSIKEEEEEEEEEGAKPLNKTEKIGPPRGVSKTADKTSGGKAREKVPTSRTEKIEPPRGVKRKTVSALLSDDSDDEEKKTPNDARGAHAKPVANVKSDPYPSSTKKKGALISESDSDSAAPVVRKRIVKGKRRASTPEEEEEEEEEEEGEDSVREKTTRSLMSMMDIDDNLVDRVRQPRSSAAISSDVDSDADVDMNDDSSSDLDSAAHKKAKRQPRKKRVAPPLGKDGRPKRRIVKSRSKMEGKYTVVEDYSSWESVGTDEEEAEAEPAPTKGKGKAKGVTAALKKPSNNDGTASKEIIRKEDEFNPKAKESSSTKPPEASSSSTMKKLVSAGFKEKDSTATVKKSAAGGKKTATAGAKGGGGGQKGIASFFGPPKPKAK